MVSAFTASILSTRVNITDFAAYTVQSIASLIIQTVFVVLANASYARDQRVTLCTSRTYAIGLMILGQTFSSAATLSSAVRAWIETFFIVAGLVIWTIRIDLTFRCNSKVLISFICGKWKEKITEFPDKFLFQSKMMKHLRL